MPDKFRPLAEDFWVAPQITVEDVRAAAERGARLIINNRPDGEEPGQPGGAEIEKAAREAGLAYAAIPISGMSVSAAHLDAFDAATAAAGGPVLAFCRSGTRSTVLRAMARARAGDSPGRILEDAARAGYDLEPLRAQLEALAPRRD